MIRICSWCNKKIEDVEPLSDNRITHGICQECAGKCTACHKREKKPGNTYLCRICERANGEMPETHHDTGGLSFVRIGKS